MICDRCYRPLDEGAHGLYVCPLEPRLAAFVQQDSIPGGLWIEHGICNPDGTPKRYDSYSEIKRACAERGVIRWTDVYEEKEVKAGQERAKWMEGSAEFRAQRKERQELRAQKFERFRREEREAREGLR